MYNPLVSVIIPNYCHAKYLDQRIQTVLGQTYTNFEVIILDDASPDNGASKAVIEKYRENPHVSHIVYNDQNSGSTFIQWNKGFELAKGELIWIAESDDYCDKLFLETAVDKYEKFNNLSIVFCTSNIVDEYGTLKSWQDFSEKIPEGYFEGRKYIKRYMLYDTTIMNASAVVFNRIKVQSIDRKYINYKAVGDYLFWIFLLELGGVYHIAQKYNSFRQHDKKVTCSRAADGTQNRELYNIVCYLKEKGYVNFIDNLSIADYYIHKTLFRTNLLNPSILPELLAQWNCHHIYNRYSLPIVRLILKVFKNEYPPFYR